MFAAGACDARSRCQAAAGDGGTHANAPLDFVAGEAFHHGDWCGGVDGGRERGKRRRSSHRRRAKKGVSAVLFFPFLTLLSRARRSRPPKREAGPHTREPRLTTWPDLSAPPPSHHTQNGPQARPPGRRRLARPPARARLSPGPPGRPRRGRQRAVRGRGGAAGGARAERAAVRALGACCQECG